MQQKQNTRKIYVVGGDNGYSNWMEGKLVGDMESADLVVFTGGEDVTPSIYGSAKNSKTGNNPARDEYEVEKFKKARSLNKKMIGICRGAQLLCALAGGKLVQHQDNPNYKHDIVTYKGEHVVTTSSHHQAQFPWGLPEESWKLIAHTVGQSPFHEGINRADELVNENGENAGIEVEIALYKNINALSVQGHPEWLNSSDDLVFYRKLLNDFMQDEIK